MSPHERRVVKQSSIATNYPRKGDYGGLKSSGQAMNVIIKVMGYNKEISGVEWKTKSTRSIEEQETKEKMELKVTMRGSWHGERPNFGG